MKYLVSALVGVFIPFCVYADCLMSEDGLRVKVTVEKCVNISPHEDNSIKRRAGNLWETWNLEKLYTGALITDAKGERWVYPSDTESPCQFFPIGATVEKAAYRTCCDTGEWGKCVFGGSFLGDIGGKKINTFQ